MDLAAAALRVYEWNDLGEYTSSGASTDLRFRAPCVHLLRVVCAGRVLAERRLLVRVAAGPRT